MVFTVCCGRALWRALCVHCTCTAKHAVCAILLLEACRRSLCLWVAAAKMKGFWYVQTGICSSMRLHSHKANKTNLLRLGLVGSSFDDETLLGFWHVQKGICSSLRLHSHEANNTNLLRLCLVGSSLVDASIHWATTLCNTLFTVLWMEEILHQ